MMPLRTVRAKPPGGAGRQGFVLLSLLFFVAAIAIQVAISLPQAAMQAQRVREERLIYRGKQYKRAVQLYFRKYQKYPEKIDDLEETNGQRFLRRRYKDPLTGEDEWRLVHMGADGRMADSPHLRHRGGRGPGGLFPLPWHSLECADGVVRWVPGLLGRAYHA